MTFPGLTDQIKREMWQKHATGFTVVVSERSEVAHFRDDGLPLCNAPFSLSHDEHDMRIDWFNHEKKYRPCEKCLAVLWKKHNDEAARSWLDEEESPTWLHVAQPQPGTQPDPDRWLHQA